MQLQFHYDGVKRYVQKLGKNPAADWQLLFGLFVLFLLAILAFSGFILYQINEGDIFLAEKKDSQTIRTIDRDALKMLVGQFKLSDRRFEELKADKPGLVDPGI
ncbi:MAG: hypothetical protein RLZZ347_674 [Candidatus Parcubacteria bacterium]|jgi:hypothetical protein